MASTTKWVLVHTVNVLLMMIDPNGIMITLMTIDNEICDDDDVDGNAHIQQERACKAAEELKWVGARQNLVTIAIVMRIDDGPVLVMMMARTKMAILLPTGQW